MAGNSILVINAAGAETRVALVENSTIHEYYLERKREKGIVGNIYKGRVVRVLPGMQAAFVDIGLEKAAFLTDLKDLGCDWRESEDGYRVFLAEGQGPELVFRTAREAGVQVRHLRPGSESLEDVFLRALGHEAQG
jgi:Rne/Rng family ribonuclease